MEAELLRKGEKLQFGESFGSFPKKIEKKDQIQFFLVAQVLGGGGLSCIPLWIPPWVECAEIKTVLK